ncbi:MAG: hypothetical protein HY906_16470 [Deltaproteobacteria bacterium]|nr:hypothetical protein [Deltaproteobacteria bacterium]
MGRFKNKAQPAEFKSPEPAPAVAPVPPPSAGYGIQQAIELMRSLPADLQTTDFVVQVVKRTLESARIDVGAVIADATRKEERIVLWLRLLQEEIATRQREIEARTSEIGRLQTELEEISRVKERLGA